MKPFYCEHYECWGITAACCIGRQFKRQVDSRTNLVNDYTECDAATCSTGAAVLKAHPELKPKNAPKTKQTWRSTRGTRECPVCLETYTPYYKDQIYCDNDCVHIARRRDRSPSNAAPCTPSSPSPSRYAGAVDTSPTTPGELAPITLN